MNVDKNWKGNKSVVDQAERHVSEYATKEFQKAYDIVEREKNGQKCGCPACKKQAVKNINSITRFLAGGYDGIPEYQIDEKGKIELEDSPNCNR